MGDLTKNFSTIEFVCPCCQQSRMCLSSVERLQRLRDDYGKPLGIVEGGGYRCANYGNLSSAHHDGMAFDLSYPREDHFLLLSLAIQCGFTGIGDKQKEGQFQMHIDDAPAIAGVRPRPWKWTY